MSNNMAAAMRSGKGSKSSNRKTRACVAFAIMASPIDAFTTPLNARAKAFSKLAQGHATKRLDAQLFMRLDNQSGEGSSILDGATRFLASASVTAALSASLLIGGPNAAVAENELSAKYGGGFDSSLVDKDCLVDKCSLQAKTCLADDPTCRKGLTCTAKCLGDASCITGCMARYGSDHLDNLLKCTIEDNECIKVAILEGGPDKYGSEPKSIAPTVSNFNLASLEGSWYKVVGFNPNYDCYSCQKNTFSAPQAGDSLQVDVQFSMPKLLPDGSPLPPNGVRESLVGGASGLDGAQSIAYNEYKTHETMVFDTARSQETDLVLEKGGQNVNYARTAHSEGEMFGLKFWENWYVIGENDADKPEFKFIYFNGKTHQNTYEGAFVYSRTRDLDESAMKKVYKIASDAGMNPDNFCKIQNGCFDNNKGSLFAKETPKENSDGNIGLPSNPFRGILASTKVSELLGVEPVAAEAEGVFSNPSQNSKRPWWFEVGDYLENPHRHFNYMDSLREKMDWPDSVKN